MKKKDKNMLKRFFLYKLYKDISNYIYFIKTIKREKKNPLSLFNKYKMQHNIFYTKLLLIVSVCDEFDQMDIYEQTYELTSKITPINKYLDESLGLCELISVSKPDNVIDVNGESTLSFGVLYNFEFLFIKFKNIIIYAIFAYLIYLLTHYFI